jgi:hypothetical protein
MATYSIDLQSFTTFAPGLPLTDYVQGTITTDCSPCILSAADITGWNLTVAVHGQTTETLTDANSYMRFSNANAMAATPSGLFYDFQTVSEDPTWFQVPSPTGTTVEFGYNAISWEISPTYASIAPPSNDLIGNYIASVPEPSTWALLLLGFVLAAWCRRDRPKTI